MGAPAIVIASAHHGDVLAEAFGRYEREYDVRHVHDEDTARGTARELMTSGHPVATRAGVSRDTARNQILLDSPDALAVTALRTRSVHAREVLVEAAWPGRTAADFLGALKQGLGRPGGIHGGTGAVAGDAYGVVARYCASLWGLWPSDHTPIHRAGCIAFSSRGRIVIALTPEPIQLLISPICLSARPSAKLSSTS